MGIADLAASRSSCPRKAVGAVIVTPDLPAKIISTGYNGAVKGQADCGTVGCFIEPVHRHDGKKVDHCTRSIHAEVNALLHAERSVKDCVMYVTTYPCWYCVKAIYQAGIRRVIFRDEYGPQTHPLLQALVASGQLSITKLEQLAHSDPT